MNNSTLDPIVRLVDKEKSMFTDKYALEHMQAFSLLIEAWCIPSRIFVRAQVETRKL